MAARSGAVRTFTARTPWSGRTRRQSVREEANYAQPEPTVNLQRAINIGQHLNTFTGEVIGDAYIPLPTKRGTNESITVEGPSGTGKSIVIRRLIEYYSLEEHRCVIVVDPTKNQYRSLKRPQNRSDMLQELRKVGLNPVSIPDVEVYVPIYDIPVLTWQVLQRDWEATKAFSIRTSGLTASGFFELGDKEPAGRDFQRYLEKIMNVPRAQKTIRYIMSELYALHAQRSTGRSADSLINIFEPLCDMGIIRDDGTDVMEMLHPPRKNQPGKVSVISLGTVPKDRRRDALLSNLIQQLFEAVRDDKTIRPVFVIDETKQFAPREKGEHKTTRDALANFNVLVRAWDCTRIWGFQYPDQVEDSLIGDNSTINIKMSNELPIAPPEGGVRYIHDVGLSHVFVQGVGGEQSMDFYAKWLPCGTEHVD